MREKKIVLAHGEGGKATARLIDEVFMPFLRNPIIESREDAGAIDLNGNKFAFTVDAFVIEPIIFPGGDIGKLAVSGTVNDLSAVAADPMWFSASFILEEGLDISILSHIIESFSSVLSLVGAKLVSADTKVVPRGNAGGGIFITTSAVGRVLVPVSPRRIQPGDEIVISGDIARHAAAILAAREGIETNPPLLSDCAPVWDLVRFAIESGIEIHAMRDPTRGGLATVCVEIAETAKVRIELYEKSIPIRTQVAKLCDIYGYDPLYMANEGKMLFFVREGEGERLVKVLRKHPLGTESSVIGKVVPGEGVVLHTKSGGIRKLIMLEGEQLPRIC